MVCFSTIEQSSEVLQKIYTTKKYSDITLVAGKDGQKIRAHKVVLEAALEYFEMMFSGSFKEATDSEVKIENIDSGILEAVIRFLYLGLVEIPDMKTAIELLEVSHLMKITALQDHTKNYMIENIAPDNCLGLISFAKKYELMKLCTASTNLAVRRSFEVIKTDEFKNLGKKEMLHYTILLKNRINVNDLAQAIYDWIISDESQRNLSFMELLHLVDLTLIKEKDLILKLHSTCIDFEDTKNLVEDIYQLHSENTNNDDDTILIVKEETGKKTLTFYNIVKDEFVGKYEITENGNVVGVWQGKIVIINSEGNNRTVKICDLQRNHTTAVGTYCVKELIWQNTKLYNGCLHLFSRQFYLEVDLKTGAFKNVTSDGFNFESCVFFKNQLHFLAYNSSHAHIRWLTTKQENWKRFASLHNPRQKLGRLVLHDKKIYLFDLNKVLVYNEEKDKWTQQLQHEFLLPPQLVSIQDKLLVIYNNSIFEYSEGTQNPFKSKLNTLDRGTYLKFLPCN